LGSTAPPFVGSDDDKKPTSSAAFEGLHGSWSVMDLHPAVASSRRLRVISIWLFRPAVPRMVRHSLWRLCALKALRTLGAIRLGRLSHGKHVSASAKLLQALAPAGRNGDNTNKATTSRPGQPIRAEVQLTPRLFYLVAGQHRPARVPGTIRFASVLLRPGR
jgi:hypothetical protein